MVHDVKYRIVSILDSVKGLVRRNLFLILIFSAFYILGFIIGICVAVRAEDAKASLMAFNWLMGSFAINNMNIFLVFIVHLLFFAVIAFVFALITYNVYFSFVYIALIVYLGMSLGGPIVLLVAVFGLGALIIEIVAFVLFEIIFAAYFILFASHMFTVAVENHRFGCNCSFINLIKPFGQQFIFLAALLVVQSFLLFMCSVFIL